MHVHGEEDNSDDKIWTSIDGGGAHFAHRNFGHFWAPLALTFFNVKNHGGGGAKGGIARKDKRKQENNTQRKPTHKQK